MLGERWALLIECEQDARAGTILYLHGGSFVMATPETAMSLTASLVVRTGVRAISLDHRVAPEHPFLAAIDDALARTASCSTAGSTRHQSSSPETRLAVAFASPPACERGTPTFPACRDRRVLTRIGRNAFGSKHGHQGGVRPVLHKGKSRPYRSDVSRRSGPKSGASNTGYARRSHRFPPLLLQMGTNELPVDDSTRLAERARSAGVDVILDVTANVPHVFQAFTAVLDEADRPSTAQRSSSRNISLDCVR
jgi:acetyl esterase/lipase